MIVKLKICRLLTEKDKLKEIYRRIKKEVSDAEDLTPERITNLMNDIKNVNLNVAMPEEYFYEAIETMNIEKLHEIYKKRYEEITKAENKKKQCFERFYGMLE